MTEQQRNSYADEDFRQIIAEIESHEDDKVSARAEAAGKCSQIAKRIKNTKATAKSLGIPKSILEAVLKTRKLERKLQEAADEIPEDMVELWEEASGQFSIFAPVADEADEVAEPEATPASKAAKRRKKAAAENQEREQAEGAEILADLVH